MALADPQDTLAYHMSRPLTSKLDLSNVSLKAVLASWEVYKKQASNVAYPVPEAEALEFYGKNHAMAEIQKNYGPYEPLGSALPFVKDYYASMNCKADRAFYYLLLICTRESRHVHSKSTVAADVEAKFDAACGGFVHKLSGLASHEAVFALEMNTPETSLSNFVNSLRRIFYKHPFSSSFGGKAWGQVCDCLCSFVDGKFTGEMMLDTIWTLSHNNGPIFNKGMLYKGYSPNLLTILDVQRSGQIPELVVSKHPVVKDYVSPALLKSMQELRERYPDSIGDYVDWFKVEDLGSKAGYPAFKTAQVSLHGLPKGKTLPASIAPVKNFSKNLQQVPKAIKPSPSLSDDTVWEIYPSSAVPKYKPARAA